ncbi:MAG: tetratricopeptide repeat protein [Myxococcota bacterium]|nr:tetratricopeptide repeat protein [Myxococcota bacterium]
MTASHDDVYSRADLCRLSGATDTQLRRWDRCGILPAKRAKNRRLRYNFNDLVAARTAVSLAEAGAKTSDLRRAVSSIGQWFPSRAHPLSALRVQTQGRTVIVRIDDQLVEPESRQIVLGLDGRIDPSTPEAQASSLPSDPSALDARINAMMLEATTRVQAGAAREAEKIYRQCLTLDPSHLGAMVHLGNLIFDDGRIRVACEVYRAATRAHPASVIAWYNLGNALDELGFGEAAAEALVHALRLDQKYANAHFNLALILEKLDDRKGARRHWKAFLALEPNGESARTAQAFLDG